MARVCTRFLEESFDLFCESCFHVESFVIDEGSDHHLIINFFLVGNKDLRQIESFLFWQRSGYKAQASAWFVVREISRY